MQDTPKSLGERIEQLEKRIEELERATDPKAVEEHVMKKVAENVLSNGSIIQAVRRSF